MSEITITRSLDAQAFGPTYNRNVAQALFSLGVNGVSIRFPGGKDLTIIADAHEATIERAARVADRALAAELELRISGQDSNYHALIAAALAND